VLAYSNGNPNRPADPAVVESVPTLSVSNVGCSRWTGTSRVTVTDRSGGVKEASATVTFEGPVEGTEGLFYAKFFQPVSGTVTIRGSNIADGACTIDIVQNSKALTKSDTLDDGTFAIWHPNENARIGENRLSRSRSEQQRGRLSARERH
jgi:hypothetical protein